MTTSRLEDYLALRTELSSHLGVWTEAVIKDVTSLHALTLSGSPDEIARRIADMAGQMKATRAPFQLFKSALRYPGAVFLLRHGMLPDQALEQMTAHKQAMKVAGLPRGEPWIGLSALILLINKADPADALTMSGLKRAYDVLKKKNFFSLSVQQLPVMAAIGWHNQARLETAPEAVDQFRQIIGRRDGIIDAALISLLGERPTAEIAQSTADLRQQLIAAKLRNAAEALPLVTLGAMKISDTDSFIENVRACRDGLKQAPKTPSQPDRIALNLVLQDSIDTGQEQMGDIVRMLDVVQALIAYYSTIAAAVAVTAVVAAS